MRRALLGIALSLVATVACAQDLRLWFRGTSGGGGGSATYISSGVHDNASTTTYSFGTAAAGDILLMGCVNAATASLGINITGAGALTALQQDYINTALTTYNSLFWKQLSSGDVAIGTVTLTNGNVSGFCEFSVYRGATTATLKSGGVFSAATDSFLTFTGFTPSGASKGIVALIHDRDTTGTPTATGFVARGTTNSGTWLGIRADELTGYAGAGVTFNNFATTFSQTGWLIELT